MTEPAALVLDLGGVAARWLPDRRLHELSALSGLPPGTIDQLVFESGFDDAGERGRFDERTFTEELARLLGLGAQPDIGVALRAAWASAYDPDQRVLGAVARTNVPTALFTNNGPLLAAALSHELASVGAAFDRCLFSWELGAAKPDPEGFGLVAEVLGVAPDEVLFVDDSQANVDAAAAAGWQAHRFTTVLGLQDVLHRTLGS